MTTGKAISKILKKRGMTQRQLAIGTGLSTTAINQIVQGYAEPHNENLERICEVLNVPSSIMVWYGVDLKDVPEDKQEAFLQLYQPMMDFLDKIYFEQDDTKSSTDNS